MGTMIRLVWLYRMGTASRVWWTIWAGKIIICKGLSIVRLLFWWKLKDRNGKL